MINSLFLLLLTTEVMNRPSPIRRILAALLDFLLVGSFSSICLTPAIICFVYLMSDASFLNMLATSISFFIGGILCVILILTYSVVLPTNWHGQTLGKRFFNMKTQKINGDNVDYKSMFSRVMLRVFIVFITLGLSLIVDLITLIASKDHLTFYDILASTIVVDSSI